MNVFEVVKQSVTTRQAAEHYGIHVGRNGMACCPFHNDKTPSMKLDLSLIHIFKGMVQGFLIELLGADHAPGVLIKIRLYHPGFGVLDVYKRQVLSSQ